MKQYCWIICSAMLLLSCMDNNSVKNADVAVNTSDSLIDKPAEVISKEAKDSLPEFLFDVWGTPHAAFVNIKLNPDASFVFNDCDEKGRTVVREGTYEYKDGSVILHYKDGSSLKLICKEEEYLYTKDKSHYLVKGLKVPDPEEEDSSYYHYLHSK